MGKTCPAVEEALGWQRCWFNLVLSFLTVAPAAPDSNRSPRKTQFTINTEEAILQRLRKAFFSSALHVLKSHQTEQRAEIENITCPSAPNSSHDLFSIFFAKWQNNTLLPFFLWILVLALLSRSSCSGCTKYNKNYFTRCFQHNMKQTLVRCFPNVLACALLSEGNELGARLVTHP